MKLSLIAVIYNDQILFQTAATSPHEVLEQTAAWINSVSDDLHETANTIEKFLEDGDYIYEMKDIEIREQPL